jgi:tripartite-type tricarboxylate transporter receptor subunit TctC
MKRLSLVVFAVCCLIGISITAAAAQDKYPSKTIRIIVPYAPGGSTDIVARIIGEQMRQIFGQSVIIENKPGAFGIIAIEELNRSKPDGYTLMVGNVSTNAITPVLYAKKLSRPYETSIVTVMRLVDIPHFILTTTKNFPPKSVAELIAYAKERPGQVRYGTVGLGSYPHYDMAIFAKRAGNLDMTGIPNKAGASGVLNDMMTGDTQAAFLNVASSAPVIQAGLIRPLAVVNPTRLPEHPNVPTMAEVGFAGVGTSAWQIMVAPAGTPPAVLETIRKATVQAMQVPSVVDNFKKQNFNITPSASLDEAKAWAAAEMAHWKQVTEEVKIEVPD